MHAASRGVLLANSHPRVWSAHPALTRRGQPSWHSLEWLYGDLGLPEDQARRHARLDYALHHGSANRATQTLTTTNRPGARRYLEAAVDIVMPPDRAHR